MSDASRKSKAEARCEAQRERILRAARHCFVESGFHAANMASIAETAGVSAGLIYRYFESKNAIILAIIERHLTDVQSDIRQLQQVSEAVANRIVERFRDWRRRECEMRSPGLFLEIAALAHRDPQVAEALRTADRRIRAEIGAWLVRAWEKNAGCGLADAEIRERVFVLQCFFEGLMVRAIKQPDSEEMIKGGLRPLLAYLFPDGGERDRPD